MRTTFFASVLAVLTITLQSQALAGPNDVSPAASALKSVASSEIPAKAVELITTAKPEQQAGVTADVVQSALKLRPTMASAVVSAIASKSPENAATATARAVSTQPKQARLITRTAVGAAPAKVREIVKAACKANPNLYQEIAMGASIAAPTSGREILEAVTEALPALKPRIDRALAGYQGTAPSVAAVLDPNNTPATTPTTASTVRGPTIGGPFVPLSGTPTNAPPGGDVDPGSRDYARP